MPEDAGIQAAEAARKARRAPHPMLSLAFSLLFTGLGQIYNGQYLRGLMFVLVQLANFVLIYWFIGLLTAPAFWLYGLLDAVTYATRLHEEQQTREALQEMGDRQGP